VKYQIDLSALRTTLFATLSCQCPVTEQTERALFQEYFRLKKQRDPLVNFDTLLEIADRNPQRTPIHNLFHFCSYSKDDPSSFKIVLNDSIRYFCSKYHFDMVQMSQELTEVSDKTSYHVSHMLLPIRLSRDTNGPAGVYFDGEHSIRFSDIFIPPELEREETSYYGIHMGTVLCPLAQSQVRMVEAHLKLIKEFAPMVSKVPAVSFRSFGSFVDYRAQVANRFKRHYPG
jgi:hypothetical protein